MVFSHLQGQSDLIRNFCIILSYDVQIKAVQNTNTTILIESKPQRYFIADEGKKMESNIN